MAAVAGFFDHEFAGAAAAAEDEDVCWWPCGHGEMSISRERVGRLGFWVLGMECYLR